ncbi:hypothetical protein Leryth_002646 [Lithospermum erythrorhizon]|nr:hypothetical protein Leryth_002646 [Lithospermum erythrorhizon]
MSFQRKHGMFKVNGRKGVVDPQAKHINGYLLKQYQEKFKGRTKSSHIMALAGSSTFFEPSFSYWRGLDIEAFAKSFIGAAISI